MARAWLGAATVDLMGITHDRPCIWELSLTDSGGDPWSPAGTMIVYDSLGAVQDTLTGVTTSGLVTFDLEATSALADRVLWRHEVLLDGASAIKGTIEIVPRFDARGKTGARRTTTQLTANTLTTALTVTVTIDSDLDASDPTTLASITIDGGTP